MMSFRMRMLMGLSAGAVVAMGVTWAVVASAAEGAAGVQGLPADKVAAYMQMVQEEIELGAQQRLLTLLSEERRGRAEAAQKAGKGEVAKWEGELSKELQSRSAMAQVRLGELTKKRQEFEQANRIAAGPQATIAAGLRPGLLAEEEALYLERIDQRLGVLQDELNWLQETQRVYVLQLATNNTPDEVSRVSWLLDDSNRVGRDLQRQQSDLQLKKLEFRALKAR